MANTKITNPELFNLGDSTSATQLPVMTTAQRIAMNAPITTPFNIDYLVVAGGGGGGGGLGAGGGAGGLLTNVGGTSLVLATGGSGYTITVGDGGSGGQGTTPANNGDNSEFSGTGITTITSDGGGRGGHIPSGSSNPILPSIGGSGGGGAWYAGSTAGGGTAAAGLTGQGNTGGNAGAGPNSNTCGGGGGGAGNLGAVGTSTNPPGNNSGAGGNGLSNSITGSGTFYAGGGAGGVWSPTGSTGGQGGGGTGGSGNTRNGGNGSANTGGGGGGGVVSFTAPNTGGTGGSGIVILRYPTADIASYTATGLTPTETTVGTDTILSFTTVGTGTITFTSPPPTNAISTGEMIFNSTTDKVEYFDGTKWYGITYEVAGESPYNNVLYTGNGGTKTVTGVGFQPDFVWIKNRTTGFSHSLQDTVRGTGGAATLSSDGTWAEGAYPNYGYISAFNIDGFALAGSSGSYGHANTNQSNNNYVAWCWKAGGAAVSNTDGDITSQVSANVAGGFSIVSWSGNSVSPSTVGHGLGVAPELFIIKNLSSAVNWSVYSSSVGVGFKLLLNELNQASATSNYANTSPTSSVFSLSGGNEVNGSGSNYIAYCFHSVPGYSKVGSYTGTGAGTTITTGFQPAFVMIKKTSGSADWIIFNDKTGSNILKPNTTASEVSLTNYITYNSTGFTFPTGDSNINTGDFIFMSFA